MGPSERAFLMDKHSFAPPQVPLDNGRKGRTESARLSPHSAALNGAPNGSYRVRKKKPTSHRGVDGDETAASAVVESSSFDSDHEMPWSKRNEAEVAFLQKCFRGDREMKQR